MAKLESFLSKFFIVSILISAILISIGGALYLYDDYLSVEKPVFFGAPQKINSLKELLAPAMHLNPRALVELGTFFLLLTPILRVLFCNLFFLCKKNYSYFSYTCLTLILLILSSLGFIRIS